MKTYARSHLTDPALFQSAATHRAQNRTSMAELLADIAEIDARKAYVPAGYPSMFAWCAGELGLTEDCILKNIQAARTARQFPAIFPALAEGRLHVSGVCLLAPHLTEGSAADLLAAAMGKTSSEIRHLLAQRFPRSEELAMVEPLPHEQHAPEHVGAPTNPSGQHAPEHVETQSSRATPIAPERYSIRFTFGQSTLDKLQYAQELLSHQILAGDVGAVLDRALDALIPILEKQKFAATDRPRPGRQRKSGTRHIPAEVKRAVWERDGGQCTFVSEAGHRCEARTLLQYDHIDPFACGGQATIEGMRLRCHAHNQFEAERMFGTEFMNRKREEAQRARQAAVKVRRAAPETPAHVAEVIPWLRQLGFRMDQARSAAALCADMPEATLEQRVKVALSSLSRVRPRSTGGPDAGGRPIAISAA